MAFSILYTVQDEKGKESTTTINLPAATSFDDVVLFAGEMAKLINPIITGAITRIGLAYTVAIPVTLRTSPSAFSDVEEGGKFQYRTDTNFYTSMRLPTFNEAKVNAGSRSVNIADVDVAAFITAMLSGIDLSGVGGSGTVEPCDSRGDDVGALEFAREQFQSSRG